MQSQIFIFLKNLIDIKINDFIWLYQNICGINSNDNNITRNYR